VAGYLDDPVIAAMLREGRSPVSFMSGLGRSRMDEIDAGRSMQGQDALTHGMQLAEAAPRGYLDEIYRNSNPAEFMSAGGTPNYENIERFSMSGSPRYNANHTEDDFVGGYYRTYSNLISAGYSPEEAEGIARKQDAYVREGNGNGGGASQAPAQGGGVLGFLKKMANVAGQEAPAAELPPQVAPQTAAPAPVKSSGFGAGVMNALDPTGAVPSFGAKLPFSGKGELTQGAAGVFGGGKKKSPIPVKAAAKPAGRTVPVTIKGVDIDMDESDVQAYRTGAPEVKEQIAAKYLSNAR
jgi:hypothetical protein